MPRMDVRFNPNWSGVISPVLYDDRGLFGVVDVPDWQLRVHEERNELHGRLTRLADFLERGAAPVDAVELLHEQRKIMQEYLSVLDRRIATFGVAA